MERVKTGIKGLDDMLAGGFLAETANLVEGAPGTGKTTLGMQFIYNGITQFNEPGLIMTFEEFPQQYYRDAETFGWDFRGLEQADKLRVIMTSPEVGKATWSASEAASKPWRARSAPGASWWTACRILSGSPTILWNCAVCSLASSTRSSAKD